MGFIARRSSGAQIWVPGAHGMLGLAVCHALSTAGHAVSGLTKAELNALELQPDSIPLKAGDIVINCIGLVNRRLASAGQADFMLINALWPRVLADHCVANEAHLVHISTDCVFAGAGAPHNETARPDASDLYGRSKALGEPANARVVRSSIIGPELHNHYSLLCWLLGHPHGASVSGYTNHLWNGVTTLQMGTSLAKMIELGVHRENGILHLHSNDVSKFELLQIMNRQLRGDLQVQPVLANEPRDMRLATANAPRLQSLAVPPLEEQIAALKPLCSSKGFWTKGLPA
jgi:dTDP-4-dehydrorhamnose reductase